MFGLLVNFYRFCRKKTERKITIALLGLDNAGKTTLLNSIQGEVDRDTTPTFGFNSTTLNEGKYKIEVFDLGGGKNIRGVWKKYLAEVHAIVYVVDAADPGRFEESKMTMAEVLENQFMRDKPICIFANKQDLPTAAPAAEVVKGLGLATCRNSHNVFPCTAKMPAGQDVDHRLRDGLKWLVGTVDREFGRLDPRVQTEAEEVRQEEARKKKEREERLRKQREERLRQQKEEEERAREVEKENELHDGKAPSLLAAGGGVVGAAAAGVNGVMVDEQQELRPPGQHQEAPEALGLHNGLALGLPHTIESPGKFPPPPRRPLEAHPASDLRLVAPDQGVSSASGGPGLGAMPSGSHGGGGVPPQPASLPHVRAALPPLPPSAPQPSDAGVGSSGSASRHPGAHSSSAAAPPNVASGAAAEDGPEPDAAGTAAGEAGSGSVFAPRPASAGGGGPGSRGSGSGMTPDARELGSGGVESGEGTPARLRAGAQQASDGGHGNSKGSFSLVHTSNKVVPVAPDLRAGIPGAPNDA
uniref:ADP-ribosylation factor-like protein 13B n=2 Tax=Chlamydomonas reinhardtii TaxID=3055 RepID=ARL13_CHLRE|nr:RecName: Full=ADP-ribosylation factor-like protein 13B; Short=CrArl13B [Chlamydomonas reinhardtii]|eukprot:XP_001691430.1 ARF-like GTPase [Chlamydomonas reinhardtii]